jgi:hypothetical protein
LDNNPELRLGLLIAYYPSAIPDPKGQFPNSIRVLVHLVAGDEIGVTTQSQMIGIQGKRRTTRKKIQSGIGTGGSLSLAYPSYTYNGQSGFAEHDLEEYDRVSAELAWSRSLAAARKAFGQNVDIEGVLEQNVQGMSWSPPHNFVSRRFYDTDLLNTGKFFTRNLQSTLSTYTAHKTPHVTHIPTLTGAIGAAELQKFYSQFFGNPPSLKLTLLSRTIGTDRVVDEVHVRFKHTQEMPWILPGVPATNKSVKILVVSIITLRGGKLYHENVYWDQASVLVQVGLLDPKLVSDAGKKIGVEKLPVVGGEAATRILKGRDRDNELIQGWDDDDVDDGEPVEGVDERNEEPKVSATEEKKDAEWKTGLLNKEINLFKIQHIIVVLVEPSRRNMILRLLSIL